MASNLISQALIESVLSAVEQAGQAILEVDRGRASGSQGSPEMKSDGSPVTQADRMAHSALLASLSRLQPHWPVVSEEDEASWPFRKDTGTFWLIDPLDGTREFIARNGEFTVNVALIQDGQAVLGVVGVPMQQTLYWGGLGLGAWMQTGDEGQSARTSLTWDQHERRPPGDSALRVMVSRSHLDADTRAFLDALGQSRSLSTLDAGSSLKFCRLAQGKADLYPRFAPTHEWDTAAAQAVLEGAGGLVVDRSGQRLRYGKAESLNPGFLALRSPELLDRDITALMQQ